MKKFFALAVALLAFTAQAVNVLWTIDNDDIVIESGKTEFEKNISPNAGAGNAANSGSFATLVKIGSITADTQMFKAALWQCGNMFAKAYDEQNHLAYEHVHGGNTFDSTESMALEEGKTYLLTITIEKTGNTTSKALGYIGATKIFEKDLSGANGLSAIFFKNDDAFTILSSTAYDGVLTVEEVAKLAAAGTTDLRSVPEPTVLALLALGVAGVVLRRRAA